MYKESNKTTIYAKGRAISSFFQGMSSFYKLSLPLGTNSGTHLRMSLRLQLLD